MSRTPVEVDLLALPRNVCGRGATTYWGMVWLVVIEATVVAWLLASYFYLRVEAIPVWPPPGIPDPDLLLAGISSGALLLSIAPVVLAVRGVRRGSQKELRLALPVGLLLVLSYLVLSIVDANDRTYRWDTHAYGSIVWTITGYQLIHAVALLALGAVVTVFGVRGEFTRENHRGLEATALYWYFVAVAGLPVYATLYLAPYVL